MNLNYVSSIDNKKQLSIFREIMNYWLMKTEPGTYAWSDLERDKKTFWNGVRNYQARNYLKEMKVGDLALIYHSVNEKAVQGVARIVKEYYQDPSTSDDAWVAVDIAPEFVFKKVVTLDMVKKDPRLAQMVLVKNSRLSVQPVKPEEFDIIVAMSETP
jgi:predicted RNA-binding protein with PUA-like domain